MEKDELTYHVPVLLKESVDGMNIRPDGTYVDVTFGGAGHSREILSRLGEGGRLLGFDQDEDAERNIVNDPHFTFVRSNFRYLHNFLRYHNIEQVDAILADLGVSSHHFDDSERGFSFRFDGDLDMRMNKRAGLTAADILNTYEEERLADIFYLYGELKNSRKLASVIVKARNGQQIRTIGEFLEIIKPLFGREREKKELAKVFQALRIEVNQEMEALKEMLLAATEALKPGGRLVVITYHSLEDRMVKNIMKTGNVEGKAESDFFGNLQTPFRLVNNKVIVPPEDSPGIQSMYDPGSYLFFYCSSICYDCRKIYDLLICFRKCWCDHGFGGDLSVVYWNLFYSACCSEYLQKWNPGTGLWTSSNDGRSGRTGRKRFCCSGCGKAEKLYRSLYGQSGSMDPCGIAAAGHVLLYHES